MFAEQIAKGVEYLDGQYGLGWVFEVDCFKLNMFNARLCVCGQLEGDSVACYSDEWIGYDKELGFNLPGLTGIFEENRRVLNTFKGEWLEKIDELRKKRVSTN